MKSLWFVCAHLTSGHVEYLCGPFDNVDYAKYQAHTRTPYSGGTVMLLTAAETSQPPDTALEQRVYALERIVEALRHVVLR